jgi:hypothetical protein
MPRRCHPPAEISSDGPCCHNRDPHMTTSPHAGIGCRFAIATAVAERIVYLDGRLDFTELSSSQLIAAARQIIRERVEER